MLGHMTLKRYTITGLTLLLMHSPLGNAALIGLQPGTSSVAPGASIALDLVITDLGNFGPDSLGAFDITVGFDTLVLSFTSYSLGDFLGQVDLFEAIDVSSGDIGGAVNLAEVSLLSTVALHTNQPADFILATLNFDVAELAKGTVTELSVLGQPVLANAFGGPLAITGLDSASVEVATSTAPAPGTLFLLGASLLGWLALRKQA